MEFTYLYYIAKSLHLIGMVSWMAGLFYLVRIMVNHAEALRLSGEARTVLHRQYGIMEGKAWRVILAPAIVITWVFGTMMLAINPTWLSQGWMHVKLLFLLLLTVYSWYCKQHIALLQKEDASHTHVFYRALNEVPTILMTGIIFLAVLKNNINWYYLTIGLLLFSALIFYAVKKVAARQQN